MESIESKGIIYEFGKFIVDPEAKTVYADGSPMHLPAKEFETLLVLIKNNGRALSKDEMMSKIWGETFVEEVNLAKQISRLRKVLQNDGGIDFIETIPKHGYRFSAEVRISRPAAPDPVVIERQIVNRITVSREIEVADDAAAPPRPLLPAASERRSKWLLLAALALVVIVAGGYVSLLLKQRPSPSAIHSLAVLPFENAGGGDGDDLLRLGLADALTTKLGSIDRIVVRPTNAVRPFADQDAVTAGRSLRVDAVLDGSIQRVDDRVRVSVQLIDVASGNLVWGGTFDETFTDIFRVQDAIAAQVGHSLELSLSGEEQRRLTKRYTANVEAHYAYVRGRYFWNKRTVADLRTALDFFKQAIELDPNYALAHAGLADTYSLMADYRAAPTLESYQNALGSAKQALELDPDLAEANTSLAYVSMYGLWDFAAAEKGYAKAVAGNPNYATAHQWFSEYLASQGRTDEALTEIRRAKEIDPLSPVINAGEVWVLHFGRRYDEAIDLGKKLAELNPAFAEVHEYLKRSYDQKAMYREAIAARQMRRKLVGLDATETVALRVAANATDASTYWRARLEQELAEMKTEGPSSFDMAEIYAQLGDKDKAFEWLERSAADRTYTMIYLKVAPNLDPLRSDPRFPAMLERVGLARGGA